MTTDHAPSPRRTATARLVTGPVAQTRWRPSLLGHGAGRRIEAPRPGRAGRATCRSDGHHRGPGRAALAASPARRSPRRRQLLDECLVAVVDQLRPRTPLVLGGRSAGARVGRPDCASSLGRRRLPRAGVPAAPARPAGAVAARRAARRRAADAGRPGGARPVRGARGVPAPTSSGRRPGGRPRVQGAEARRDLARTTRWGSSSRLTLEWVVARGGRESNRRRDVFATQAFATTSETRGRGGRSTAVSTRLLRPHRGVGATAAGRLAGND